MPTVEELQRRVNLLQNQLRKAGEHLKSLATENNALGEQVEKLAGNEARLQAQTQELKESNDNYKSEIESLKSANQATSVSKKQLETECDKAKEYTEDLEKQIVELKSKGSVEGEAESQLSEWETIARDWAAQLGVSTDSDATSDGGLMLLRSIKSLVDASELNTNRNSAAMTPEMSQLRISADRSLGLNQDSARKIAELEAKLKLFADGEAEVAQLLDSMDVDVVIPESISETLRPGLERVANKLTSFKRAADGAAAGSKERAVGLESKLEAAKAELNEVNGARDELAKDYDLLLERIGTMKDALKAKMNAESDELKRLRKELTNTKSELNSAKQTLTQQEKKHKQAENAAQKLHKELDETKRALWESQETANRIQSEISDLTDATERQISELRVKLQTAERQLESEFAQHNQFEDRIEQLQSDLNQALNSESQWVEEREVHLVTIQNLQSALESLQESKDTEIDFAVEKLREELRKCTKNQKAAIARAEQAESRLRRIELSGATAEQCQQKISEQLTEIERLRHEVAVLKDHLNESMRRLREESNEFNLDKRVITNLIVGFLAMPYGDSKRYEIMQLMSSILQFTEEQQEKVGLIRKAGRRAPLQQSSPSTPASEPADGSQVDTKESFSDQWISFLLRESSATRNKRT